MLSTLHDFPSEVAIYPTNRNGGLTFRRKDIDLSTKLLRHIQKHIVIHDLLLPNDNAALSLHIHGITPTAAEMLVFANQLGSYEILPPANLKTKNGFKLSQVDVPMFRHYLPPTEPLWSSNTSDIETLCENISRTMCDAAKSAKTNQNTRTSPQDHHKQLVTAGTTSYLVTTTDHFGGQSTGMDMYLPAITEIPSDHSFCEHFKSLHSIHDPSDVEQYNYNIYSRT